MYLDMGPVLYVEIQARSQGGLFIYFFDNILPG